MTTQFRIRDVFEVTGRGRFVSGTILDGRIAVGMLASPTGRSGEGEWRVGAVEFVDQLARHESDVALLLLDAPPLPELRRRLPAQTLLDLR